MTQISTSVAPHYHMADQWQRTSPVSFWQLHSWLNLERICNVLIALSLVKKIPLCLMDYVGDVAA